MSRCPPRSFPSQNGACWPCHETCETCAGPGQDSCLTCAPAHLRVTDLAVCLRQCPEGYIESEYQFNVFTPILNPHNIPGQPTDPDGDLSASTSCPTFPIVLLLIDAAPASADLHNLPSAIDSPTNHHLSSTTPCPNSHLPVLTRHSIHPSIYLSSTSSSASNLSSSCNRQYSHQPNHHLTLLLLLAQTLTYFPSVLIT